MNEFDSFLNFVAEELYEIERDIKRMEDFNIDASKRKLKLEKDLERERNREYLDKERIKKIRDELRIIRDYIKNLNRSIRDKTRMGVKVSKYIEQSKDIKSIIMTNRIGGIEKCPSMNSNVRSVRRLSKKSSGHRKKKR